MDKMEDEEKRVRGQLHPRAPRPCRREPRRRPPLSEFDLEHSEAVRDTAARTSSFVREVVLPVEDAHGGDVERAGGDALRRELQAEARIRGLLSPHGPVEHGGLGLGMVDRAPVFEAAGHSLFGPLALNCAAPDEGNVHLLAHVATAEQKEEFLRPLVQGDVRSAFAMTEPAPGAGSDPTALRTAAPPGPRRLADHRTTSGSSPAPTARRSSS